MFPETKSRETFRFERNKIHCFPKDQSLSELLYSKTKQKQILKNALRFQRQHQATSDLHRGQTSEHAREIARGSHRSIRKTLHVAVKTAASSCELEAKFSFYFSEVHRQGTYDMNYKYAYM